MNTSRERFLLKEEDRRRGCSSVACLLAGIGFAAAFVAAAIFRLADHGPVPSELLRPFAGFVGLLLLVLGAGLWTRLRPRHFVAIDTAAGTAAFVRGGTTRRQVALSEVGPLSHSVEERQIRSGKSSRIATFHVGRSEPFPELLICESETELTTRRSLERHARAWNVPYVKPTGERRNPEELDVPLFQRVGSDEAVTTPLPQRPGSKLEVAWKDGGYEISTSYSPPISRGKLLVTLVAPPVLVGWIFRDMLLDALRPETPTPLRLFAAVVAVLSFVPGLAAAAKAWRRSSSPPVIRISTEGVRFRGTTLTLRSIEEIERVPSGTSRFVSDERIVTIDADFCEPTEYEWLHHELRRLVVEAGLRSPLA